MHEFALCQELVRAALAEMAKLDPPAVRLCKARLIAGALNQVEPASMTFAFAALTQGTLAEGAELEIVIEPVAVRCTACGRESAIELPLFACAVCGASAVEVLSGTALYLTGLEVERA